MAVLEWLLKSGSGLFSAELYGIQLALKFVLALPSIHLSLSYASIQSQQSKHCQIYLGYLHNSAHRRFGCFAEENANRVILYCPTLKLFFQRYSLDS